jgi:phage-related protein
MRLRYYTTSSERRPVAEYVEGLAWPERAVLAVLFEEIASRGLEARGATFRQIEGKLWEIRAGAHRIFYVLLVRNEMVLLHAYRKHSQKVPLRHLQIARRRLAEVLE